MASNLARSTVWRHRLVDEDGPPLTSLTADQWPFKEDEIPSDLIPLLQKHQGGQGELPFYPV